MSTVTSFAACFSTMSKPARTRMFADLHEVYTFLKSSQESNSSRMEQIERHIQELHSHQSDWQEVRQLVDCFCCADTYNIDSEHCKILEITSNSFS